MTQHLMDDMPFVVDQHLGGELVETERDAPRHGEGKHHRPRRRTGEPPPIAGSAIVR
jgi:hypothetical protein